MGNSIHLRPQQHPPPRLDSNYSNEAVTTLHDHRYDSKYCPQSESRIIGGAASQLGSQDQKSGASEHQGVGSAKFKEGISDQRQEPSIIGKMFNNVMNGTDSTK